MVTLTVKAEEQIYTNIKIEKIKLRILFYMFHKQSYSEKYQYEKKAAKLLKEEQLKFSDKK